MLTILSSIKEGSRSVCISGTFTNSWGSWHLCGQPVWPQLTQHRHQLLLFINFFQSLKDVIKMFSSPSTGLSSCWACQWLLGSMMSQPNVTRTPLLTECKFQLHFSFPFWGDRGLGESFCVVCIGLVLPIYSRQALSQPLCMYARTMALCYHT